MPSIDDEDLPQGGRRRKWIQEVVGHMKKSAFTKQALRKHMTTKEFANDVTKHPEKYTLKTRRRAQFLKNIHKSPRKTLRRK